MKPILIIPPDTIHSDGIKMLRDNGICVVTAKNPQALRFVEPLPTVSNRTQIEAALLQIGQMCVNGGLLKYEQDIDNCCHKFAELLTKPQKP